MTPFEETFPQAAHFCLTDRACASNLRLALASIPFIPTKRGAHLVEFLDFFRLASLLVLQSEYS